MSDFYMEDDLHGSDRFMSDRRGHYNRERHFRDEEFLQRERGHDDRRFAERDFGSRNIRDMRDNFPPRDELDMLYDNLYDEDEFTDRGRDRMEERRGRDYGDRGEGRRGDDRREERYRDRERIMRRNEEHGMDDRGERYTRDRRDQGRHPGRGHEGEQPRMARDRSPRSDRFHDNRKQPPHMQERAVHSKERSIHSRDGSVRSFERSPTRNVSKSKPQPTDTDPWSKWKSDLPSPTVLLMGLPEGTEDIDVYRLLHLFHSKVRDVRIVKRSLGESEKGGYGFVDFVTNSDAMKWIDKHGGKIEIKGKPVKLTFSIHGSNKRANWTKGDQGWIKWATDTPCSNILIWNIDLKLEATEIENAIKDKAENLSCCKIIRSVGSGDSRGFGFLEFKDQPSAEKWMEESKGLILMSEKPIFATYSCGNQTVRKPWTCNKCGTENYKQREFCFVCKLSKKDSEKIISYDGSEEVGTNPCNTLVFQGLDGLTCEDSLNNALYWATGVYCQQMIVMRDPRTQLSMSYAFGEMSSIQEAKDVMETLGSVLEVDGKQVTVSFTKNTFNTIITTFTYSGQQPLQPVIFKSDAFSQNENVTGMEAVAGAEEIENFEDNQYLEPKPSTLDIKADSTSDANKKTTYIDPLNIELQSINKFLYDPVTEKYYDNFTKVQCPVPDCKVKAKWEMLRNHWQRVHVPVRTGYMCQVGQCKKQKILYKHVSLLREHFKTHPHLKEKHYEEQIKRAKSNPLPNYHCVDPGTAVLPMPKLTGGPKIDFPEQKCPVQDCPHSYTTLEKMKQHWTQYHNRKVAMFRCCECDAMNRDKHFMKNHMKTNHKVSKRGLEKVMLDNKQLIDPGTVVPFWSLYREEEDDDLFEEENENMLIERLGDEFPLEPIPYPSNDPEDLAEFISWTQRYMNRLQVVSLDAVRDLKKLAKRKM